MVLEYIKFHINLWFKPNVASSFLDDFEKNVLKKNTSLGIFKENLTLLHDLKQDNRIIQVTDFGAGSKKLKQNYRKVNEIVKSSSKHPRFGRLLYHIINHYGYNKIVELGTSVGLTTSYLASARNDVKVITFEGCPEIAQLAKENFTKLKLSNIDIVIGNIDTTLHSHFSTHDKVDFVFFDANHQYHATLHYFNFLLNFIHSNSCFVFDDIYWSNGMREAWNEIKNHPRVSVSIDLFWLGIVFFKEDISKSHFYKKMRL